MAMANATCTCATCGKEFVIRVAKRNRSEADSFEKWAAAHITECRECESKRVHDEALAVSEGLPELTGSEKQIKWAIDIRAGFIKTLRSIKDFAKYADDMAAITAHKTEAKWWIDHRDWSPDRLCEATLAAEPELADDQTERADHIKQAVYDKLDSIEAEGLKDHDPEAVKAQIKEVRKFYDDVFGQPAMTTGRIIAKRSFFSAFDISKMVKDTLRDGATYDPVTHEWSK